MLRFDCAQNIVDERSKKTIYKVVWPERILNKIWFKEKNVSKHCTRYDT